MQIMEQSHAVSGERDLKANFLAPVRSEIRG
jgi:hypothetical protein